MSKAMNQIPEVSKLENQDRMVVNHVDDVTGTGTMSLVSYESLKENLQEDAAGGGATEDYRTLTVALNFGNSNPANWATYEDDAADMVAGSDAFDEFFGEYPCLLYNGVEGAKLNPNNITQDINGNAVDITSGNMGDAMVKYPRRGIYIRKSGNIVRVSMTNAPEGTVGFENFQYNAHYYKGKKCKAFYRGIFKGYASDSKLYSLSGKAITASQTIGTFRSYAQARGTGYEQSVYWHILFRQVMYLLKYKGANAQIAVGRGYVDGNSAAVQTGGANARGADWGETTGKYQCKLFHEEDAWGNIWEWFDGLVTDASRNYKVNDPTQNVAFTDGGTNYVPAGSSTFTENTGGYISSVIGDNKGGFLINGKSGSETTYLCDSGYAGASCVAGFGGFWADASSAGMFFVNVTAAASYSGASIGSRLSYFEVEDEDAA